MPLILNIDTATEIASIALNNGDDLLAFKKNENQKDHAAWIHAAIKEAMQEAGRSLKDLEAVAVTAGPGSYTGLRVGMATAKGLCYVLNIPLITESTLKMMAQAASYMEGLLCPMIDARRMEVFTAVYDRFLDAVVQPQPMILADTSFLEVLDAGPVQFFGSGSGKFRALVQHRNANFPSISYDSRHLAYLADNKFRLGTFTGLAYAEPVYLKEFHTHTKK